MRFFALLLIAGLASAAMGATIYVNGTTGNDAWTGLCETWDGGTCGPKRTIQAGVNTAINGVVIVASGVYAGPGNRTVDLSNVTEVRSATLNPADCIIDVGDLQPAFRVSASTPTIRGMTIRNAGVGVFEVGTGGIPAVRDCIIENCSSGVVLNRGLVEDCMIRSCSSGVSYGFSGSHPFEVRRCVVADCSGLGIEGAAIVEDCIVARNGFNGIFNAQQVRRCVVENNRAGGIVSAGFAEDSTIRNNRSATGAGVSNTTCYRCVIQGNVADLAGGGAWESTLLDCVVSDNVALRGGGIAGTGSLINCTVVGNTAVYLGGGVSVESGSVEVMNCILWDNVSSLGSQAAIYGTGALWVAYSDVESGQSGVFTDSGALYWGLGNVDTEPQFADAEAGDYRLAAMSPCIDAAYNYAVYSTTDILGNPRLVDDPNTVDSGFGPPPLADLGAYEFQPTDTYVLGDADCDGVANVLDINPFVLALIDPAGYRAAYPECNIMACDIDGNGAVEVLDINPFVALLLGG
ncbi:hypothetical protein RAS1_24130 [Phycisphaerae bacterium RAS1]|nr:hypothetical protein RAS1_24130 [Phycisphaerae bacterium RAS1]